MTLIEQQIEWRVNMRILSVVYLWNLGQLEYNAMWNRIFNIANQLNRCGADVDIVAFVSSINQVLNLRLRENIPENDVGIDWFYDHSMVCELAKRDYDIVYANLSVSGGILAPILRTPGRSSLIVTDFHGIAEFEFPLIHDLANVVNYLKYCVVKTLESKSVKLTDLAVSVSYKMKNMLVGRYGMEPERIVYATNGVDFSNFDLGSISSTELWELKENLGIEDKFLFGYFGGFQKWQGVENFIKAARIVKSDEIGFVIGGLQIKRPVRDEKGSIIYLPKISQSEIFKYYRLCDVLVLPRPHHPAAEVAAPTKFAEYSAAGRPVLATEVGDAADFVRNYGSGIVVADNSPENLVRGIEYLHSLPKSKLAKMGYRSRKLAEKEFDWESVGKTIYLRIEESMGVL
ncbi:glycosyltransferase [Geoglobus acetivorans]|uniref:Glycosyltransferase family 4 protein n=1 Tax=Geoglobus acetivorans TaxID=565033 RepID=A0ABZ3H3X0_GEOAI|nr:glycosyltransferase family 4 protein [Geoglobus acetivorans]